MNRLIGERTSRIRSGLSRVVVGAVLILSTSWSAASVSAQSGSSETAPGPDVRALHSASTGSLAGSTVTTQNWQSYRQFMPDGMAMLFAGKYFWKMPDDVAMEVGPTIINPLPKNYRNATEQYSAQVTLTELGDGRLTLSNYHGGEPFPNPAEPHKGWKVLANLWFRYQPHLTVDTNGVVCTMDSSQNVSCKAGMKVYRQLDYNTDPGVPVTIPGADGKYFTQYEMVKEPEQEHYTTVLTLSYADLTRQENVYVFVPALRRYQPMSAAARCSADLGTDETPDDRRFGFNTNLTQIKAELIGERKILALLDFKMPLGRFPENYDMPLGWPKPSWGKWQLRNVYVVNVTSLPGFGSNRCLGKRVMYIDKANYAPLWQDLYDENMEPWRFVAFFLHTIDVTTIGPVDNSNLTVYAFWDVKYKHATVFAEPGEGQPFYINQQAPAEFMDVARYSTVGGLMMIMR
jgi:uncharacterized protein DUF1329